MVVKGKKRLGGGIHGPRFGNRPQFCGVIVPANDRAKVGVNLSPADPLAFPSWVYEGVDMDAGLLYFRRRNVPKWFGRGSGLVVRADMIAAAVANPTRQRRQVRTMRIDFGSAG